MKPLITVIAFSLAFFECLSQQNSKKYSFDATIAAGYSQFKVTEFYTSNYPTLEMRVGAIATHKIAQRWALSSGINFAFKFKRNSYVNDGNFYSGKGSLNKNIDETASQKHHYSFEIPLLVKFHHNDRLSFNVGVMARFWGPTDLNSDILASQQEIGLLIGGQREFSEKIGVGLDFYSTLIPVLAFGTRNQFAQLKLIYHFNK